MITIISLIIDIINTIVMIWKTRTEYVHQHTGEVLTKEQIKSGEYRIVLKDKVTTFSNYENKEYGKIKITYICTENQKKLEF